MITVVMAAVVDPVAPVPIAWGSGIICVWIPGIRIVVNVRAPIVSVWIII